MKSVLYRPSWQRLRVSCLSKNNALGGFTTTTGTTDNLNRLNNYIEDANPTNPSNGIETPAYVTQECVRMKFTLEQEYACRVWRVLNMMNATHMGFSGQGLKGSPMDRAVVEFRDLIQPGYNGNVVDRATTKWDWDVVQFELEELWRNERYWFDAIWDDLYRRQKVATKRRRKEGDLVTNTRPELIRFVDIMERVNRIV